MEEEQQLQLMQIELQVCSQCVNLVSINNCGTEIRTSCDSCNSLAAPFTPSCSIYCHHSHSVVTEFLQSCQCMLPGSTIYNSTGASVGVPSTRILVCGYYLKAVNNLPLWLCPDEIDGCGRLRDCCGDGGSRGE